MNFRTKLAILSAVFILAATALPRPAAAQHPPNTPVITSPTPVDSVSPFDVHMETAIFSDPDPGDSLATADWEILLDPAGTLVWYEYGSTPLHGFHTHLGDGIFTGPYAGQQQLQYSANYKIRTRQRDKTGLWSLWAQSLFHTGLAQTRLPMMLDMVGVIPTPHLEALDGSPLMLSDAPDSGKIQVEGWGGGPLFSLTGGSGTGNNLVIFPQQPQHYPVRVTISGASGRFNLPASRLVFADETGTRQDIYLPALNLGPGELVHYWVSVEGASWHAYPDETGPNFTSFGYSGIPPIPYAVRQPGFAIQRVATGFQLPMSLAMFPSPGPNPGDPFLYVAELYGRIKLIHRDGTVTTYADSLLNFNPTGIFPGTGEQGIGGICVDPPTGDLFVTILYDAAPPNGPHYARVLRMHSNDGGRTRGTTTVVLDMPGEPMTESHYISSITVGPDAKLYVHVGDGFEFPTALDMTQFRGKVLRMNKDGSAPSDNPFYNASNGITATDYIFAYGFRNPFGGTWRLSDSAHYEVENGANSYDRFARVDRGTSYGWQGTPDSMAIRAIYNWSPTHAPVAITCTEPGNQGGSGFPASRMGHLFVTESGETYASGPQTRGKRVVDFDVNGSGQLVNGPTTLLEYVGNGKSSAGGLTAGPDGLYFTDLYSDFAAYPSQVGADVYRVVYVGSIDGPPTFVTDRSVGVVPMGVVFTNQTSSSAGTTWKWDFGDGFTSTLKNPTHIYVNSGAFDVTLTATAEGRAYRTTRRCAVIVGGTHRGLRGAYYRGTNFNTLTFKRTDPGVSDNWVIAPAGPGLDADSFTVRWTGRVVPEFGETYTFHTISEGGARLWVDGQLLVNHLAPQPLTDWSGSIALRANFPTDLTLEYQQVTGNASIKLQWSSPSTPLDMVPGYRLCWADTLVPLAITTPPRIDRPILRQSLARGLAGNPVIEYAVPGRERVMLRVYDIQGRRLATLQDGVIEGGAIQRSTVDASRLASGIYFARLTWRDEALTTRIVRIR